MKRPRNSTFRKRLKLLREGKKLSFQNLSDEVNIATSTLNNWEIGVMRPTLDDRILDLADYFDVTLDYLAGVDVE